MFEPRRFVELRKQTFWKQVKSAESFGMGLFYTLNVFFIQFYLGAPRLITALLWRFMFKMQHQASSMTDARPLHGLSAIKTDQD